MNVEEIKWKYGDDVRYAYAMGVIRVRETQLLTRDRIDRAADAFDAEEVLRILAETIYSDYLSGLTGPEEYESFLEEEHQKTLNLLRELSRDPRLTDIFFRRFDFHNLKVAVKERFVKQELTAAYVPSGSIPVEILKTAVTEEDFSKLPSWLGQIAEQTIRKFSERQDPKWIDISIDKEMFHDLLRTSREEGNLFIHNLVQREIDVINILSLFRIRWSGQERGLFLESFISGGRLSLQFLLELFDDPFESLPGLFAHTPYRDLVEEGWEFLHTNGSFVVFERMGRDLVLTYVREANLIAFGIEPLVAYVHAKENELRMIRTIIIGKLNNLHPNMIKESLPRVYL
ncbi:MAG: V-type ATP synthase subunit C [Proteobacteria bacterium]|nr:V-type ATP synthase subunit C [Pseudomonadota bacterium]